MKKLAVLISNKGTGTNLQAIIDGIQSGKMNAKISVVVSDTEEAKGLERATKHNLPIEINKKKGELLSLLKSFNPDYVCLAGWKQIITDEVIESYPNKILNIHPGLIPDTENGSVENPDGTKALWNKGKLTDQAINEFLQTHATYVGSTVHFLTKTFDFGPVLGRVFEKIEPHDTIDSLYTRLKVKENQLYVNVLEKLCKND